VADARSRYIVTDADSSVVPNTLLFMLLNLKKMLLTVDARSELTSPRYPRLYFTFFHDSMGHSPSWEADSHSNIQEVPRILMDPESSF
jgi:hypothetical protein